MLIQFDKTSRQATGARPPAGSHMRGDGGNISPRNPAIQLRADPPRLLVPVAPSRVEENDGALFLSACCAALRDVAAIAAAVLFICATGIGFTAAIYLLLFVSL